MFKSLTDESVGSQAITRQDDVGIPKFIIHAHSTDEVSPFNRLSGYDRWMRGADLEIYPSGLLRVRLRALPYGGKRMSMPKGKRGKVGSFSAASKLSLMKLLSSVRWDEITELRPKAPAGRSFFLTVSYRPVVVSKEQLARDLDLYLRYCENRLGKFGVIWRKQLQKRGSPHYHMVWVFENRLVWEEVRKVSTYWKKLVDSTQVNIETCYLEVGREGALMSYLTGYMCKNELNLDGGIGRSWGRRRLKLIPMGRVIVKSVERGQIDRLMADVAESLPGNEFVQRKSKYWKSFSAFADMGEQDEVMGRVSEYEVD